MYTVEVKPGNCPWCGYQISYATDPDKERLPKKDDISICISCEGLLQFNEDLTLRKIDDVTYQEICEDDDLRDMVKSIRESFKYLRDEH